MVKMIIHMRPPVCGGPSRAVPLCGRGTWQHCVRTGECEQWIRKPQGREPPALLFLCQLALLWNNSLYVSWISCEAMAQDLVPSRGLLSWDSHHFYIATLGPKLLAHQLWGIKQLPTMEVTQLLEQQKNTTDNNKIIGNKKNPRVSHSHYSRIWGCWNLRLCVQEGKTEFPP